ncbi:DUF3791 domain-containing protein [Duncaniella sp.]|uniref:DUF3791 domain-containing protein n=1 Tax=Duncaniella sp. TaxID=2518496 RepID=UPI0023BB40E6|nr:DUF3791 domain-containing protein [Duncaniella sp.]MDE5904207.1 DUF3791 domain-containing protein [Duncaniella sp.]
MTEESRLAFLANKSANIIKSLSDLYKISIQEATDIYYQSDTSELIADGISDLQCRSDKYLATLIWDEHQESAK